MNQTSASSSTKSPRKAMFGNNLTKCTICGKTVYKMEEVLVDNQPMHKACFRCFHCKRQLTLSNFAALNGKVYCKAHYIELFQSSGGTYNVFEDGGFKSKSVANQIVEKPTPTPTATMTIKSNSIRDKVMQLERGSSSSSEVSQTADRSDLRASRSVSMRDRLQQYQQAAVEHRSLSPTKKERTQINETVGDRPRRPMSCRLQEKLKQYETNASNAAMHNTAAASAIAQRDADDHDQSDDESHFTFTSAPVEKRVDASAEISENDIAIATGVVTSDEINISSESYNNAIINTDQQDAENINSDDVAVETKENVIVARATDTVSDAVEEQTKHTSCGIEGKEQVDVCENNDDIVEHNLDSEARKDEIMQETSDEQGIATNSRNDQLVPDTSKEQVVANTSNDQLNLETNNMENKPYITEDGQSSAHVESSISNNDTNSTKTTKDTSEDIQVLVDQLQQITIRAESAELRATSFQDQFKTAEMENETLRKEVSMLKLQLSKEIAKSMEADEWCAKMAKDYESLKQQLKTATAISTNTTTESTVVDQSKKTVSLEGIMEGDDEGEDDSELLEDKFNELSNDHDLKDLEDQLLS